MFLKIFIVKTCDLVVLENDDYLLNFDFGTHNINNGKKGDKIKRIMDIIFTPVNITRRSQQFCPYVSPVKKNNG